VVDTEIQKLFQQVRHSNKAAELLKFVTVLAARHDEETMDYHYSLLKESDMSDKLYDQLCRSFPKHGEPGEVFLLHEIKTEKDSKIKGIVLQILGSMKYYQGKHLEETAKLAREYLQADHDFLRNRATIVLGWIGDSSDMQTFQERLFHEKDPETRGWTASALMQLYFNNDAVKKQKKNLIDTLKNALLKEQNDFVLTCILVSLQEIMGEKLGISATTHDTPPKDELEKAKIKALKLLGNLT
jgi:hypothetical protein